MKYPIEKGEEERWQKIVQKSLNAKCRGARAQLRKNTAAVAEQATRSDVQ